MQKKNAQCKDIVEWVKSVLRLLKSLVSKDWTQRKIFSLLFGYGAQKNVLMRAWDPRDLVCLS